MLPSWRWPARLRSVRYRLTGGDWRPADDPADDFHTVFDLPDGLQPGEDLVNVEAEVTTADGRKATVEAEVRLPRRDPRLSVAAEPGTLTGSATVAAGSLSASVRFPEALRALVTSVRYRVYPAAGGEPTTHVVEAGWFAPSAAAPPKGGTRTRSTEPGLPLVVPLDPKRPPGLVEAHVVLCGRKVVRVPLWLPIR